MMLFYPWEAGMAKSLGTSGAEIATMRDAHHAQAWREQMLVEAKAQTQALTYLATSMHELFQMLDARMPRPQQGSPVSDPR